MRINRKFQLNSLQTVNSAIGRVNNIVFQQLEIYAARIHVYHLMALVVVCVLGSELPSVAAQVYAVYWAVPVCMLYVLYGKWPWTSHYVRLSGTRGTEKHPTISNIFLRFSFFLRSEMASIFLMRASHSTIYRGKNNHWMKCSPISHCARVLAVAACELDIFYLRAVVLMCLSWWERERGSERDREDKPPKPL